MTEFSTKLRLDPSVNDTALVYFFCDNQDHRRKSASSTLHSLIYLILCQRPDLTVYLHNEYEKQCEQLFSSPNSLHTLWRLFQTIMKRSSLREILIVIDAVDECDKETMETLLIRSQGGCHSSCQRSVCALNPDTTINET